MHVWRMSSDVIRASVSLHSGSVMVPMNVMTRAMRSIAEVGQLCHRSAGVNKKVKGHSCRGRPKVNYVIGQQR